LYYGALKGTSFRWLNLAELCDRLLPPNDVYSIKYFTAPLKPRPGDSQALTHQQIYLRALRTLPNVEVILGHFLANKVRMPLADGSGFAEVIRTEEKGSDVNIATHLMADAFRRRFEVAVLVTNDSDLKEPVRIITQELDLKVGIISPVLTQGRSPSRELTRHATFVKRIRKGALKSSQFPNQLSDSTGTFHKPTNW
ncbi:MAG: NYN domain-containing protein, partial [Thermoanaerobaculia bacterium]